MRRCSKLLEDLGNFSPACAEFIVGYRYKSVPKANNSTRSTILFFNNLGAQIHVT
jgi:hypothetical protein